jgi:eukaryotic-like serine/threonine-protein kinase
VSGSLQPGSVIGPYRITERIGRGGMATVYKAHHDALSRYVAIKVLPEFLAEQEGFKERFQQEAVAIAHLRHPSILAVYDYGEEDGNNYIVEEFVEGGTLSDRMGKPHALDETVSILSPVASALDYAHARGVLHRDVKPSNIMLTADGTPILGDFGLAKMMGGTDAHLTMSGMIVGTPEYMAPEQCAGRDIDASADVYSLAVVAYQMLTGQVPFTAATPAAVLVAQMKAELPPPRSVNPNLSESAESALLKGLAKQPADRWPTAGELIGALASADSSPSVVAPKVETVVPAPAPPPSARTPEPSYPSYPTTYPSAPAVPPSTWAPGPPSTWGQGPPSIVAESPAAASAPFWVLALLGIGAGVCFLIGLLFLVPLFGNDEGVKQGALFFTIPAILLAVLQGIALLGLYLRQSWGRGLGFVAGVALCLTIVGALLGGPLIYGLMNIRTSD